jgi:hypothetical protein
MKPGRVNGIELGANLAVAGNFARPKQGLTIRTALASL